MIALTGIHKSFPTASGDLPVLKGIDLSIREGEYVALTGSSGSGKSTLLSILGCLDRPTSGRYVFAGTEVGALADHRQAEFRNERIGLVFQAFNLIPALSIEENVEVPLFYAHVARGERRVRAKKALEEVGLGGRFGHRPAELSGGEQQRVAVARALVRDPQIILADEPTGNLDSKTGERVLALFKDLHDRGKTILMVTHDLAVARQASRRIHLVDGGIAKG
jgi:putative ABC transport system ATP-binding protein